GQTPYTTVIEVQDQSFNQLVNHILKTSYQLNAEVRVLEGEDISVLIVKLPDPMNNSTTGPSTPEESGRARGADILDPLKTIAPPSEIIDRIQARGLIYLQGKDVRFTCSCSRERFIVSLKNLTASLDEIFHKGQQEVEVKCDYCKTYYLITRDEV